MPALITKFALAYLLGSCLGGLIVGKFKGGIDIRRQGSGNAGGTNALRTQGAAFALWVMLIDIGKGWLAVTVIAGLPLPGVWGSVPLIWLKVVCAFAVVLGHVYPIWFGFRGGKGAATLVGVLASLAPAALPPILAVWLVVLMLSGFVGLSTMLATMAFPLWLAWRQPPELQPLLVFGVCMALFVVYTHRSNIRRMLAGTENKAQRLWLLKPR